MKWRIIYWGLQAFSQWSLFGDAWILHGSFGKHNHYLVSVGK